MTDFLVLLTLWLLGAMLFALFPSKLLLGLLLVPVLAWAMYRLAPLVQRALTVTKS